MEGGERIKVLFQPASVLEITTPGFGFIRLRVHRHCELGWAFINTGMLEEQD